MSIALEPYNLALAGLQPIGATMTFPAYGAHAGRTVTVATVEAAGLRYDRATVDGVSVHFPAGRLSLTLLGQAVCERVARPRVGDDLARYML